MQACDDFLDELLSHEVAGDGRVPDIRYYLDSEQEAKPDMGCSHWLTTFHGVLVI